MGGITCAHIGALTEAGGCNAGDSWCSACAPPPPSPPPPPITPAPISFMTEKQKGLSTGGVAGIAVAAAVIALLVVVISFMIFKEKRGRPVFANLEAPVVKGPGVTTDTKSEQV